MSIDDLPDYQEYPPHDTEWVEFMAHSKGVKHPHAHLSGSPRGLRRLRATIDKVLGCYESKPDAHHADDRIYNWGKEGKLVVTVYPPGYDD